jgi:hypothetical protein
MTQGQHFPLRNHLAQYHDPSDDEDGELSPSDGYFGSNNSIPDAVLILNPPHFESEPSSNHSKAKEAARESSSHGTNSPSETRYTSYTPATTHTPAASSRDSESAYNGSTSRYRDREDELSERSPLLEEPPPLYDDAVAERTPSNHMNGPINPTAPVRGGHESMQVREPVSSSRTSDFGSRSTPESRAIVVDNRTGKIYDEESNPTLPQRSRRRGCCGRRKAQKDGRSRFKRFLSFLLGTILAIWLIVHLAKIAKHARGVLDVLPFYIHSSASPATNHALTALPNTQLPYQRPPPTSSQRPNTKSRIPPT